MSSACILDLAAGTAFPRLPSLDFTWDRMTGDTNHVMAGQFSIYKRRLEQRRYFFAAAAVQN